MTWIYAARTGLPRKLIWVHEKYPVNDAKKYSSFKYLFEYAAQTGPLPAEGFSPALDWFCENCLKSRKMA